MGFDTIEINQVLISVRAIMYAPLIFSGAFASWNQFIMSPPFIKPRLIGLALMEECLNMNMNRVPLDSIGQYY